jgi:hypothetical protein
MYSASALIKYFIDTDLMLIKLYSLKLYKKLR